MDVETGYDFDDVLLVPRCGDVNTSEEVDLSYAPLDLKLPIIASPMKGIVGVDLITELSRKGGLGILHRFYDDKQLWMNDIIKLSNTCYKYNFGFAVGMNDFTDGEIIEGIGIGAKLVCLDVANGYTEAVQTKLAHLRKIIDQHYSDVWLIGGNVVTLDGAEELYDAGADLVRVGIGSGALCTTRKMVGVGYPQLSALKNCLPCQAQLISDGGVRTAADIVKALACGANLVMIGTLFASCYESDNDGEIYGMASRKLQEEYFQNVRSIEGISAKVEKTQSLEDLLDQLVWNMKHAFTYLGVQDINELQVNAEFVTTGKGTLR